MRATTWVIGGLLLLGCGGADSAPPANDEAARGKVYLDVRTAQEFATGHVDGALNIPVEEIEARLGELESFRGDSIVVYCRTGRRSAIASAILERDGFEFVRDGGGLNRVLSGR